MWAVGASGGDTVRVGCLTGLMGLMEVLWSCRRDSVGGEGI